MVEWLQQHQGLILSVGIPLTVVTFVGSIILAAVVLVRLPADYFCDNHHPHAVAEGHPVVRWGGLILKNLLGLALVLFGIVLSLPGIPGQGLLTVLLGVMLLNFPGKRRLEKKLVSRPAILQRINRLRARYDKPPLVVEPEAPR